MIVKFNIEQLNKLEDRYIKKHYRKIRGSIYEQLNSYISLVEAGVFNQLPVKEIDVQDIIINLYEDVGVKFGNITADKINEVIQKKGKDDVLFIRLLKEYYNNHVANLIKGVSETIKNDIRGIVEKTLVRDLTIQQSSKEIVRQIKGITRRRAMVIARTEVLRASSVGSLAGAESLGIDFNKIWLTRFDGRQRDSHASAHNSKVPKEGFFDIEGDKMAFPRDTSHGASAKNTIQCRCVLGYEPILPEIFNE